MKEKGTIRADRVGLSVILARTILARTIWACAILVSTIWASTIWDCPAAAAQDVLIVANKRVKISQITSEQLRDIFTGMRSRFVDGTRAIPVVLKGGPVHEIFLRNHVGDNPDEFRARWRKVVFTGQRSMMKEFNSEAALLIYVAATPGAIGYVSRVGASAGVKVLIVSRE